MALTTDIPMVSSIFKFHSSCNISSSFHVPFYLILIGHDYVAPAEEQKLQTPVYMDGRHSYGHDYINPSSQKKLHGPVYQDQRHSYGHDPKRPTPEKPSSFPIMPGGQHKHQVRV